MWAAVEENSGSTGGIRDCREAGPVTLRRPIAGGAHRRRRKPPLANTYGHMDQDGSQAGTRAAQPRQEARLRPAEVQLQAHLERTSHKAHDENRRRSLQPQEARRVWQIALRPRQPGQRAHRMETSSQRARPPSVNGEAICLRPYFILGSRDRDLNVSADQRFLDQSSNRSGPTTTTPARPWPRPALILSGGPFHPLSALVVA